eukprot:15297869-Ditylum_brightwellii.AAC.1
MACWIPSATMLTISTWLMASCMVSSPVRCKAFCADCISVLKFGHVLVAAVRQFQAFRSNLYFLVFWKMRYAISNFCSWVRGRFAILTTSANVSILVKIVSTGSA